MIYLRIKLELSLTSPFSTFSLLDVADSHPLHQLETGPVRPWQRAHAKTQ
jgi:hypothetical protein